MGQQKRRRKRGKARFPKFFLITASDIDKVPAKEAGRRLHKYILPKDSRYLYSLAVFEDERRIQALLEQKPEVIVLLVRPQDMVGIANFYKLLEQAKAKIPGYAPDLKVWEVEPVPGKIPPLFPMPRPDFKYDNPVLTDILVNRSERNLLN